jgi:hypothetical protein
MISCKWGRGFFLGTCLAFALSACGSSDGVGATQGSDDGGVPEGDGAPDPGCLAVCALTELPCFGVDAESGMAKITEMDTSGCTAEVTLPVSGKIKLTLDCAAKKVCLNQGGAACVGSAGDCFAVEFTSKSFSYRIQDCNQGSLSCSMP